MISDRLKRVVLQELKLPHFELLDETQASQVPGWDSLSHVRIMVAIEREYGIRFKGLEIMRLRNVGELQKLVDRKMGS